jgi:DNA-binding transcriptional ArsR family regulator
MHALDILGDPVRRRILELLVGGELPSGAVGDVVNREFGISQPAVSQHLRVLREAGFVTVRVDAQRRLYAIDPRPLAGAMRWLDQFRAFWQHKFDALETEVARGKRERRSRKAAEKKSSAVRKSGDHLPPKSAGSR